MSPALMEGIWPYVAILVAGWLATDVWRYLGVVAAARIDEDSAVLVWVKAVATALVAGVIARLVLLPDGSLAEIPLAVRIAAVIVGFATFTFMTKRNVFIGLLAAEAVFLAGAAMFA